MPRAGRCARKEVIKSDNSGTIFESKLWNLLEDERETGNGEREKR